MKPIIIALTLILATSVLLLACGDVGDETATSSSSGTTEPTASATVEIASTLTPTAAPSTVTVAITTTPAVLLAEVPTLEEVYAQAALTLAREGMVYHVTQAIETDAGLYSLRGTIEAWVDAERNVARSEAVADMIEATPPWTIESTAITVDDVRTTQNPNGEFSVVPAPTCYDASKAVAVVLGCPGPTTDSTTTVEHGEWEGQPAIMLVETGTSRGSDETSTFTARLYLDATSYLPIVRVSEGTLDYREVVPAQSRFDYRHEFIASATLPPDFFEPASLGYSPPDLNAPLDRVGAELTVYWLGERFEPGEGLPALMLDGVSESPSASPIYQVSLIYRLDGDMFGIVTMELWPSATWEAGHSEAVLNGWAGRPCFHQEELELPIGRVIILKARDTTNIPTPGPAPTPGAGEPADDCADDAFTSYDAIVYAGETVVMIDAPGSSSIRDGYQPNPYSSQAGMLALVQALQAR